MHELAGTGILGLKLDFARDESEQSVIASQSDMVTGMNAGSALTYQNLARQYGLSGESFDAEHLGLTVTPVAG